MRSSEQFLKLSGIELEVKMLNWQHKVDDDFLYFFLKNHNQWDSQHIYCAISLLKNFRVEKFINVVCHYSNSKDPMIRNIAIQVVSLMRDSKDISTEKYLQLKSEFDEIQKRQ